MSYAKRNDPRPNRFKSWVGGVFGEIKPQGISKKKSVAKFNSCRQGDSYSSGDSGLDDEDSFSPNESISGGIERVASPTIYNNEAYYKDGSITLNPGCQAASFSVHKLKDEPSSERLVEYVDRKEDECENIASPTEICPQDDHYFQDESSRIPEIHHTGPKELTRSSSVERLKKLMKIKKPHTQREPERLRRSSFFKFLTRAASTSTLINTSDVPVTATASNPIRRAPSPTLSFAPETAQSESIANDLKREGNLEQKVTDISRFVVAMVAQERATIHRAAIKIQAAFRGFQARERFKSYKALEWYGTTLFPPTIPELSAYGSKASHVIDAPNLELRFIMTLQHLVRGFLTRRRYVLVANYHHAATLIQAAWRGYCARFKPPPNCPPLGGVVRSLATHRLAVQKLAGQIAILNKRIQAMASAPHQPRRDSQAASQLQSPSQPRFASNNRVPKRHGSVQSLRSARSASLHGADRSKLSNPQSSSLDRLASSDSTSNSDSPPRGVSRDEYNFVVSEVDSLRAVIDAILLHQSSA